MQAHSELTPAKKAKLFPQSPHYVAIIPWEIGWILWWYTRAAWVIWILQKTCFGAKVKVNNLHVDVLSIIVFIIITLNPLSCFKNYLTPAHSVFAFLHHPENFPSNFFFELYKPKCPPTSEMPTEMQTPMQPNAHTDDHTAGHECDWCGLCKRLGNAHLIEEQIEMENVWKWLEKRFIFDLLFVYLILTIS